MLSCYSARNYVVQSRPVSYSDAAGLFAWVASLRVVLSQDARRYRNMPHLTLNPHTVSSSYPTFTQPPSTGTSSSRLSSYRMVGRNSAPFPVSAVQNKILGKCAYHRASNSHTKEVRRLLSTFLKFTCYVTVTVHHVGLVVF